MNAREKIIAAVKRAEHPCIDDLVQIDPEDYSAIQFLIKTLTGKTAEVTRDQLNPSLIFKDAAGTALLQVKRGAAGQWSGSGELANYITALLAAIRVHEVDSFEWIYLPPEDRRRLVADRAQRAGITSVEFKRLMNIWLA